MTLRAFRILFLTALLSAYASGATVVVNADADIYSAGHTSLPNTLYPGSFAPSFSFPSAADQELSFSSVTGTVGCNFVPTNGADGGCLPGVDTTVTSYGGLSGISVFQMNFFLTGVFLDSNEPFGTGPSVMSYNYGSSGLTTSDPTFSPDLNQVFFIGDGLTGTGLGEQQRFRVPSTASRLFLGFADSFDSVPSYYADNVGSLTATFQITDTPEPGSSFLIGGGLIGLSLVSRKKRW